LLVCGSTHAKPTTGFERTKGSGRRGTAPFVVTESLADWSVFATARHEATSR
jgi:hypothetical protein